MGNFPTKRDFWYCFTIAVIIMLFLSVSFVVNPSKINSELGLASTIASIILSAIAIIYTLVDSSNNKITSSKIIESSNIIEKVTVKIDESTEKLNQVTENLVNLKIDDKLNLFQEMLEGIFEGTNTLSSTISSVGCDVTAIKTSINNSAPSSVENRDNESKTNFSRDDLVKIGLFIINKLPEDYYHPKELIYIAYTSHLKNKVLFGNIEKIIESKLNLHKLGICYGVIGVFHIFRLSNWVDKTKKITYFADELLDVIELFRKENPSKVQFIDEYFDTL